MGVAASIRLSPSSITMGIKGKMTVAAFLPLIHFTRGCCRAESGGWKTVRRLSAPCPCPTPGVFLTLSIRIMEGPQEPGGN